MTPDRQKFEEWAKARAFNLDTQKGTYLHASANIAWKSWQAALATQPRMVLDLSRVERRSPALGNPDVTPYAMTLPDPRGNLFWRDDILAAIRTQLSTVEIIT